MRLAIFLAEGFEETEAITTVDILRRAKISVDMVSVNSTKLVKGAHDIFVQTDHTIDENDYEDYDGFILPGGNKGVDNLSNAREVKQWLKKADEDKKIIAAICAAPQILGHLQIVDNRNITIFPGCDSGLEKANIDETVAAITDEHIITGASLGCAISFALAIVEHILGTDASLALQKTLVIR